MRRCLLPLLGAFLIAACARPGAGPATESPIPSTTAGLRAVQELKLISPFITAPNDANASRQRIYMISGDSRLLMRFSDLVGDWYRLQSARTIELRITALSPAAGKALSICPLTRDWSADATWISAGAEFGTWPGGGAIDMDHCLRPESGQPHKSSKPTATPVDFCATPGAVCFDLGDWYRNLDLRQGSFDQGFALISWDDTPIRISGDGGAQANSPQLHWVSDLSQ